MDQTLDFEDIELLYDTTCTPLNYPNSSPDMESDKSDFQTELVRDGSELLSEIIHGTDLSTDIIDGMIKSFDSYDQIKAPANCFLLYRSHVLKEISAKNPGHSSRSITSLIAENWKNEPWNVKNHFKEMAAKEKAQFKKKYPEYRRVVKPKSRKRSNSFRKTDISPACFGGDYNGTLGFNFSNERSILFSSFTPYQFTVGRKRSVSMPEPPNYPKERLDYGPNYHFDVSSRLGPLLPLTHSNKSSRLSQAFGKLN
jgi:hypothetical protein